MQIIFGQKYVLSTSHHHKYGFELEMFEVPRKMECDENFEKVPVSSPRLLQLGSLKKNVRSGGVCKNEFTENRSVEVHQLLRWK